MPYNGLDEAIRALLALALEEDRVKDDITSKAVIPEGLATRAVLQAKAEGVVSGLMAFKEAFMMVDRRLHVELKLSDGDAVKPGDIAAVVTGPARGILAAERVALNMVCHLSGVATAAARYVAEVKGLPAVITDTRKTVPGLRLLEKKAVRDGGGDNHRFNLADGILVKDNHLAALRGAGLSLGEIVARARDGAPTGVMVQIEVTCLAEAEEVAGAGADMLLLDNMTPAAIREVVLKLGDRITLEASGGITLENVRRYAETGVHRISIGAITHSARALDFSLELTSA
jgi:nicotinate-nucleotide pyrophosphorylase (carboxylating)